MTKDQKRLAAYGAGGLGVLVVAMRMRKGATGGAKKSTGPTSARSIGSVTPYTPQSPVSLEPGQSLYDPNSEALLNTPTALSAGQPLAELPQAPVAAPQAVAPAAPSYVVNVNYPPAVAKKPTRHKPTKRKPTPKKQPAPPKKKHGKEDKGPDTKGDK